MIIGAMKSGTTSLFDYLAQHDAICAASIKEPEYFSMHQQHKTALAHYEDIWRFDPQRHRYALEASVGYTKSNERGAAHAIRQYGLSPKFIYIVRDPLSRIESHYNYMKKMSKGDWQFSIDDEHLIETSNYYRQAEKFAKEFGRNNLLAVKFEDWVSGDEGCLADLWHFLELEAAAAATSPPETNVTTAIPSRSYRTLRKWLPTDWLSQLPQPVKDAVRTLDRRLVRDQPKRLSPVQKEKIHERLAPDMRAFAEVYGVDVASWGFR
jgi:hypothetical protein